MLIMDIRLVRSLLTDLLLKDPTKYAIKIHRMYKPTPVSIHWEIEEGRRNHDMHLMMVLDGKGQYTIGAETFPMRKGQLYLVSNGCSHSAYTDQEAPVSLFSMRFGIYDNESTHWLADFFPNPFGILLDQVPSQFNDLLEDCYRHFIDPKATSAMHMDVKMKHLLLELIDLPDHRDSDTELDCILEEIITRHGIGIGVSALASQVGLSEKQFTRKFVQYTDLTPHQYLLRLRLNYSKHLLEDTDMTLQAIASELGYADAFTFSRQFKKTLGVAPSEYRGRL